MKITKNPTHSINAESREVGELLSQLRGIINDSRRQALRAVDVVHVQACWAVGHHIVEFEQSGASRASYGARLLTELADRLTAEFGKRFDASNLRYMRLFYHAFPKPAAGRRCEGARVVNDRSRCTELGDAGAGASDWHSLL